MKWGAPAPHFSFVRWTNEPQALSWLFMHFTELPFGLRPDLLDGLRNQWESIAGPGTWWAGTERVAIAEAARGLTTEIIPSAAARAARTIYSDITSTSEEWVDQLLEDGLTMQQFVEVVGVVSRLAAVDEFTRALGGTLEPLPDPVAGEPARTESPAARRGRARVPMVGGASITQALSLVPAESAAQEAFHAPLYMSYAEMADYGFERDLTRPQMELIAGRVSAINECFY